MKIPKSLKIGGQIVEVRLVSGDELDGDSGATLFDKNLIKVSKDIPQTQKEETLFHEIIHMINNELHEVEVEFLAHDLYQVLKDNKLLK